MFRSEITEILARLGRETVSAPFVESPEVAAYGPAANRVARLRLRDPDIGAWLLRLSRPDWHSACAYVIATQDEDANIVVARLLDDPSPQALLAEAVGMPKVPPACLKLLKLAPPHVLPLDAYRLLARGSEDNHIARAYRAAFVANKDRLSVPAFIELLQEVTMAYAHDPLIAELGFTPDRCRVGYARSIRSLKQLGLLRPEKEERRCLRRVSSSEHFANWAVRRLQNAVVPESAFNWLTVPVPGFEPIKTAALLKEQARAMRNCAGGMRYMLECATGISCFAILRSVDGNSSTEEHLVQFQVAGRYVQILAVLRARNVNSLMSAQLHLEKVFKANGLMSIETHLSHELNWMTDEL